MRSAQQPHPYTALLKREIQPAIGCTEPVAVAICAAHAAQCLDMPVTALRVEASAYILKNAMHVGIPGANGLTGIAMAGAIGSLLQHSEKNMEIFGGLTPEIAEAARAMQEAGHVKVALAENSPKVWIDATAFAEDGSWARAVVQGTHTHVIRLERNGSVCHSAQLIREGAEGEEEAMPLRAIYDYAMGVPLEELAFLEEVIRVNCAVAEEGLARPYGLRVGSTLAAEEGGECAAAYTAAAADARMAGCMLPVMTNMGSGNQGLTASLPVIAAARSMGCGREKLLRALAASELAAMDVKLYIGRLSALCGCGIAAGIGAACGLVLLRDGGYEAMVYAVRTMVADVAGIVCDGAKPGCALKVATAVSAAQRAASLAMANGLAEGQYGVVSQTGEDTLRNLGLLGSEGMGAANETILKILLREQNGTGTASRKGGAIA